MLLIMAACPTAFSSQRVSIATISMVSMAGPEKTLLSMKSASEAFRLSDSFQLTDRLCDAVPRKMKKPKIQRSFLSQDSAKDFLKMSR